MSQTDPTSTTVGDLCKAALKESGAIGVGQIPLAEDIIDAQARMQWMLQQWEKKRYLVYHLVTFGVVSTGQRSYTVGPGGEINTSVVASYSLKSLQLNAPGKGYSVNDILTLAGAAPLSVLAAGSTAPQVQVTGVAAGGVITAFVVLNAGALAAPLPAAYIQGATTSLGMGATFQNPIYSLLSDEPRPGVNPPIFVSGSSTRPAKLEYAFLRQLVPGPIANVIDYPLKILQSKEDYDRIALKSLASFPSFIFYDSDFPLGSIYTWPVPQASIYSVNISILEQLPLSFLNTGVKVSLPPEYYAAIIYQLALRLRPKYGIGTYPGDTLPGLAKDALNTLRGSNLQIAALQMPTDMQRPGIYNIFSDRTY